MSAEELFKLCGVAVLCAVSSLMLAQFEKRGDAGLRAAAVLVLFAAAMRAAAPIVGLISSSFGETALGGAAEKTVLRVLGVASAGAICSDLCREIGSPGIASALETAAKIGILLSALPLVSTALDAVSALLAQAGV